MGTYFHGNSEIQASDGLQTLILMNPGYAGFADTQQQQQQPQHHGGNFVFFNPNHSPNSVDLIHAPPPPSSTSQPQQQQFVGIPLAAAAPNSQEGNAHAPGSVQDLTAIHGFLARPQYNFYNHQAAVDVAEAREFSRAQQGLSLSLSSQQQQQPGFGNFRQERVLATAVSPPGGDDVRVSGGSSSSVSGVSNGINGVQSVLLSSKYLKVAQELLDEVVKVGKGVKSGIEPAKTKNVGESSARASEATGDGQDGGESNREVPELSTAERQEIQMKKAKLVNMLDEVEQRYRQYHQQMQIVISWFEQAAGFGSAKTYTALALQTISKQFRCLKDAILGQIRAASKSLGEEEISLGGKMEGRLKFVDNQLRQQRALQQLGMIQHNAWRPQRGLPERSVSVLRAWLFEHFLHPYPKDSDKVMLAKQTGLTRNQVSNWFINARVRLWKPMVEEMYMEEIKEQEHNGSEGKTSQKGDANEDSTSKSIAPQENSPGSETQKSLVSKQDNNITNHNTGLPAISMSTISTSPTGVSIRNQSCFNLIGTSDMENISPKKLRTEIMHSPTSVQSINIDVKPSDTNEDQMSMKFGNERQSRDGFTLMGEPTNFMGGFGSYPIEELGRFSTEQFSAPYSSNGTVSLTLGLPHSENLSMSATHRAFLPTQSIQMGRGVDIGEANEFGGLNTPTSAHTTSVYENYNIQNRKRFATQLLPDFVT